MAINKVYDEVQLDVEFTQANTRENLVSKENISISFGKISKYFADLHSQAFTGYTHPTYTARTGKPTGNQTPGFGSTFTISQITSDGTGHVTAATDRTVKIPNTTMGAATADAAGSIGLVPAPAAGKQTSFLRGDGTWVVPTNTNTTYTLSGAYGSSSNTWVTTLTPSSGNATTSTVPTASTSVYGITKLSSATNSTSTALAATPSAVKSAYDLANGKSTVSFSASLTTGTKIGTITINGTGTDIYCETNTNTDTKVTDTFGTANTYYPAGGTSTSTATGTQVFDTSLKFIGTTGTTSAVGKAQLVLGNSTASGTANNKQGSIVVYGSTAYAHTIQGAPTAARTLTLPNKTGTVAVTSDIPTVNNAALTLKGAGTTVTTFTANASSAKSLDIVAGSNVTVTADATNSKISIASSHPTITKSTDTTSTASPAHGGTFTTVDSVTRDSNGHVTKINTKTVTLPADSNTDTLVSQTFAKADLNRPLLMSYYLTGETTTTAQVVHRNDALYFNPSSGGLYSFGFLWTDITGSTLDINTLTLSNGTPHSRRFIEKTDGGATNITNIPVAGRSFLLEVDLIRWASTTDYITRQRFTNAANGTYSYVRYCTNGTWGSWTTRKYTDTDTKVTSSTNHYAPATVSGQDKSASATGATAAWSIDVVKGVTLNTDGKGHVTGISVTSGKIPANPVPSNNVTGSGTSGYLTKWNGANTITNGPQLGSSTTTYLRNDGTWATPTNTTYSAGTGLSLSGTTFNHSNSVTAVTSAVFKKITYDAQGHITGTANVVKGDIPALDYVPNTQAGVNTAINLLSTGSSIPNDADYYISQYAGGGTTTTSYHRRPVSALWSYINGKISATASGSGNAVTSVSYSNGVITATKGTTFSLSTHTHPYLPLSGTTINNPNTSSVSFTNGMTGNILFTNTGDTNGVARGIGGIVGANDSWSVRGYQTAGNKGCLEIAVGDDGDEGIYARQYTSGAYKATFSNNAGSASGLTYRELVLMAPSTGASTFPSDVTLSGGSLYLSGGSGSYGQINLKTSSYNVMLRQDNADTYFLVTAQNDPDGGWTSARPLTINNSTGVCNINGNAATSSSWATARTLTLGGQLTGSVSVKGNANMTLNGYLKNSFIFDETSDFASYAWHKFAEKTTTTENEDQTITFIVSKTWGSVPRCSGILTAHIRAGSTKVYESSQFYWQLANSDINPEDFVFVYTNTANTSCKVELWYKQTSRWDGWVFTVLKEHSRTGKNNVWTLYTSTGHGSASHTAGTGSYASSIANIQNNTSGTSSNVTGTVAIANGGTGATTRLAALRALTEENVGTNATYFLTITDSYGKGGYTSVANVKTVLGLGTAAYKASSDFAVSQTLANDTNLNNITTPGFYNCGGTNSVTNKPSNVDAFGLNVIHDAFGQWYTQILYPNNASPLIYVRNYNGSAWSKWNSIAIGSFLPSTTKYAGSSSAGGAATSANKLNTDAGSTSIPVYFSGGVPVQCTTPNAYQTNTTTNADYRVLFSTNANDTTQSGTTRKNINLQYNPSTATLKIGDFVSSSTATKNGKLVFGNSSNVYTHTINTNADKLSNVSLTLNSTDGIMGTDALCYKGYESANLASDTVPGTLADISSLSNTVSFSGYLARFSYFTVLLCVGTDVTARTTVQVSAVNGYQSYQLIWGGAPTHSGGNLSITSGLVNITESNGTITLNFGKCASYWQFSSSSSTPTKGTTPNIHVLKVYGHSIRSQGYH